MVRLVAFLTPTAAVLAIFAAGWALARWPLTWQKPRERAAEAGGIVDSAYLQRLADSPITLPSPNLPPDQVVTIQLAGLANPAADGLGVLQCYVFASPGNRAHTGPLDRFGGLVRQHPYAWLTRPKATLVGAPLVEGRIAKVLVTVVDEQFVVRAFAFILSRQGIPPYEDCWMTESVFPIGDVGAWPAPAEGAARPDAT